MLVVHIWHMNIKKETPVAIISPFPINYLYIKRLKLLFFQSQQSHILLLSEKKTYCVSTNYWSQTAWICQFSKTKKHQNVMWNNFMCQLFPKIPPNKAESIYFEKSYWSSRASTHGVIALISPLSVDNVHTQARGWKAVTDLWPYLVNWPGIHAATGIFIVGISVLCPL